MAVAVETAGSASLNADIGLLYPGQSVFGKSVSDLVDGSVTISGSLVSGRLKKVTGWTAFSPTAEYQSGNYLPVVIRGVSSPDLATASLIKIGGADNVINLGSDLTAVFRITDPKAEMIKINIIKDGIIQQRTLDLSGLTLLT